MSEVTVAVDELDRNAIHSVIVALADMPAHMKDTVGRWAIREAIDWLRKLTANDPAAAEAEAEPSVDTDSIPPREAGAQAMSCGTCGHAVTDTACITCVIQPLGRQMGHTDNNWTPRHEAVVADEEAARIRQVACDNEADRVVGQYQSKGLMPAQAAVFARALLRDNAAAVVFGGSPVPVEQLFRWFMDSLMGVLMIPRAAAEDAIRHEGEALKYGSRCPAVTLLAEALGMEVRA